MKRLHLVGLFALISLLVFSSCSEKEKEITVQSIAISQPSAELVIGETLNLKATVSPSNATYDGITWTSTKTSVATVSGSGQVSALAEGNTTITAMAGGKTASCSITVVKGYVTVSSISLNKDSIELVEGDSETLTATVSPNDATDKTVSWTSSNDAVATVKDGTITGVKEGEATITAKAGEKTASCKVVVAKKVIPVEKVSLDKDELSLIVGESAQLVATIEPNNATDKSVSWSSSDEAIASVDKTGVVVGKAEGNAVITAKVGDKSGSCSVLVSKDPLEEPIVFADNIVKRVCVSHFDTNGDGEVSYAEAAKVNYINSSFFGDYSNGVISFDELQYFTGLQAIPSSFCQGCRYLKRISIPERVTRIMNNAFNNCSQLESVSILGDINSIGDYAFYNCSVLNIDVPESCTTIGEYAFSYTGLTHVTIPDGTREIKRCAFMGCPKLESVQLPSSVTKIDIGAFIGCKTLNEVSLPSHLTFLGEEAFSNTSIKEVRIPETLVSIPRSCFSGTKIENIVIPANIATIGQFAFGSGILKTVTINNPDIFIDGNPFSSEMLEAFYGPLATQDNRCIIKDNVLIAFAHAGLSEYVIPDNVKVIGEQAGFGMPSVVKLTFPSSLETIRGSAFYSSKMLETIDFPDGLKAIKGSAFFNCTALKTVSIPDSVTEVGSNAFGGCRLDKMIVGKNADFAENAGYWCGVIEIYTAVMRATTPPKVCPYNIETLYVPTGSKSLYEESSWNTSYTKSIVEYDLE